ncbi:hypothetical protein [Chelativorans alearense]|uniref:hypothetical protein n=1 Tax=Chelativorans alearense TaxID=2681495 RepID=UPI0013D4B903|nr:hypothetical protein [Chelativorans alearense]
MALYAKLRAWVIWLFWFYIRYGKEMPRKKALMAFFASCLWAAFAYEAVFGQFSREPGWSFNKVAGYFFLLTLPALILTLYGYLFGYRHRLEALDPVYTRPNPLEPIGFAVAMLIIGLARVNGWW